MYMNIAVAVAACCIAGCATPNFQPFADQTAGLANAIAGEQREIASKLKQLEDQWGEVCKAATRARQAGKGDLVIGDPCGRENGLKIKAESFKESRRVIDALMEKTVVYASSVASLAKAGDTGAAAAQSLIATAKEFGSIVGAGVGIVGEALGKISDAVTKVQAQQTLADATAAAGPVVNQVADQIDFLYSGAAYDVAAGLASDDRQVQLELAGRQLVGVFEDAVLGREVLNRRLRERNKVIADLRACTGNDCSAIEAELKTAEDLNRFLDRLRPDYELYLAKRSAVERWYADREDAHIVIRKAAREWKLQHARLEEELKRCGGLNAYRCVELNATTLKALVARINDIRSEKGH